MRSLDIGATGMLAQQTNVDVISNNIANMSTAGFKRQRATFQDLMYQNINKPGTQSSENGNLLPTGLQLGLGVQTLGVQRIHSQGTMNITENELDMAIIGKGFFQISLPSGETAYTRDGNFTVNENGELVTQRGYVVEPSISIPDNAVAIEINIDGEVLVDIANQANLQNVGQLQLANFINPAGLEAKGDNLFVETEASGSPITGTPNQEEFGRIQQGAIEQSNVNVVEEITRLISAQRAYEMNSKIITASDEMMQTATQLR